MVAKFDKKGYEVCGPWECGIGKDQKIVQLIDVPKGCENMKLYYGEI